MECGKLTAKLRDGVPVCFIENGKEVKRFKNIEIPDEIKKLPYQGFDFSVPVTGERRKALVEAVKAFVDAPAVYQNAPSFAYVIGDYTVSKTGTISGPANEALMAALNAKGLIIE